MHVPIKITWGISTPQGKETEVPVNGLLVGVHRGLRLHRWGTDSDPTTHFRKPLVLTTVRLHSGFHLCEGKGQGWSEAEWGRMGEGFIPKSTWRLLPLPGVLGGNISPFNSPHTPLLASREITPLTQGWRANESLTGLRGQRSELDTKKGFSSYKL